MDETYDKVRVLLRKVELALLRQLESERTPKERDQDFIEAQHAHRAAASLWMQLQRSSSDDDVTSKRLTEIATELADLEIRLAGMGFNEADITLRLPSQRAWTG